MRPYFFSQFLLPLFPSKLPQVAPIIHTHFQSHQSHNDSLYPIFIHMKSALNQHKSQVKTSPNHRHHHHQPSQPLVKFPPSVPPFLHPGLNITDPHTISEYANVTFHPYHHRQQQSSSSTPATTMSSSLPSKLICLMG